MSLSAPKTPVPKTPVPKSHLPKSHLPQTPVASGRVSLAKAPAAQTIFVCAKCAKKLPGRLGAKAVRAILKDALKRRGAGKDGGKVRIVQAGCFDLCPKRRQVLASGRTLANARLVVMDTPIDPDAALDLLLD
jgi:hypothetical protein